MNAFLLLRNITVENANAIAGQTWGFPAITHFLGFGHALQRKLAEQGQEEFKLQFSGCAVICHQLDVQSQQANAYSEHVFSLTRNPLTKEEKSPSFVEEGRARMKVSVLLTIEKLDIYEDDMERLEALILNLAQTQRLAGGLITHIQKARVVELNDGTNDQQEQVNFWMRTLLPGYLLVARPQLLREQSEHFDGQANPVFSAWLDNSTLQRNADKTIQAKNYPGWVRPIVTGYRAISPLYDPGEVAKSRDAETPVRFVEYAYTLGEWLSPHRINRLEQVLWHYDHEPGSDWYVCKNHYEQFLTE
ncbi:type I-F CRISPR-associated protein Csy2 [Teredinibacter sp. KSP-S5-2]|uniref:type I-F CRISPR-associated protein Csy2 n=1 Tax=Teredinibacter sp. KSP-S5-2 TaxID=3034506 RepID=UPI0029345F01|nr:type I-F CRISPR-associated protein Csy2 [Teredinibacter sp. KSP-S5-2]WNO08317.1 type I-F CRISPR-associated protein Csy2 [Teredinibacter sp. KSP-S5-2]